MLLLSLSTWRRTPQDFLNEPLFQLDELSTISYSLNTHLILYTNDNETFLLNDLSSHLGKVFMWVFFTISFEK